MTPEEQIKSLPNSDIYTVTIDDYLDIDGKISLEDFEDFISILKKIKKETLKDCDLTETILKYATKQIHFEKMEAKLRYKWTKGEIRNELWRLAYNGSIQIDLDYNISKG